MEDDDLSFILPLRGIVKPDRPEPEFEVDMDIALPWEAGGSPEISLAEEVASRLAKLPEVNAALDMDDRWPMVRAARDAMIWAASGLS